MKKLLTLISTTLLLTTTIFGLQTKAQDNTDTDPKYNAKIDIVDPNNVPSYVKDYLKCPTKFLKNHYGLFTINNEDKIEYQCPLNMKDFGCNENIRFNFNTEYNSLKNLSQYPDAPRSEKLGWTCDVWRPSYGGEGGGCTEGISDNSKYASEMIKFIEPISPKIKQKYLDNNIFFKCIDIPTSILTKEQVKEGKNKMRQMYGTVYPEDSPLETPSKTSSTQVNSSSTPISSQSQYILLSQVTSSSSSLNTISSSQNISTSSQSPQTYSPSSTPTTKAEQTNDQNQPNYTTPIITAITIVLLGLATYFIVKSRKTK